MYFPKNDIFRSMLFCFLFFFATIAFSQTTKSARIKAILDAEDNADTRYEIEQIVKTCKYRYSDLYSKLEKGDKITIFIDPAHGKLSNGQWQGGGATFRQSTTEKPEEFYSIPLSRELYKLLVSNKYIRVATTRDYMSVLREESNTYNDISFTETINLANKTNSFLIVSSHLNNISPIHKADGLVNMYGIHITKDRNGSRYISHITSVQRGFLTLYNKFDPTGFSRRIAERTKENHISINMYPNAWDDSIVADDRFSYFSEYPFSVIYESGFISNPVEERFLRIPENQKLIAQQQYLALVASVADIFGVDISNGSLRKAFDQPENLVNDIILARLAVYYIKKNDRKKAIPICNYIAENTNKDIKVSNYYKFLATRLSSVETNIANAYRNRKKTKLFNSYLRKARKAVGGAHIFSSTRKSIIALQRGRKGGHYVASGRRSLPYSKPLTTKTEKHSVTTPFLLTIKPGQTLKEAIDQSIAPSDNYKKKVYSAFSDVKVTTVKWVRNYSKKNKKYIWVKKRYKVKKTFKEGIYVVKLDKKFNVISVKEVKRVTFDPTKYQNQEYFKNSCLSNAVKDRSL
ncbi:MAG TPA: N-acetylmuramoyl-L-alanine amidase [Spirochaetota bacterium]|nr:N-acetylmuramoyl-L-alanine amidase [Spirochaetota bacterium]